ncbi:hypothetical protein PSCICM_08040 [Pseudomonas cichorii]|uniref:Uncharacterized protein n=1 Tax=Pseudomonas cichorii TaxID=36746 RepID=A0ABQ1DVM6_PSECI|nr:hypothetical protein PSCICJ_45570 [Pseudomonas cichorii]GFM74985.1 hypothetical protein PSCICM_08040 [Pseudomonas cichorii]GFM95076.1 hypothetical protein PSCICP_50480 [Pseudomonas cichorii]
MEKPIRSEVIEVSAPNTKCLKMAKERNRFDLPEALAPKIATLFTRLLIPNALTSNTLL